MITALLYLLPAVGRSTGFVPNLPDVVMYEANIRALGPKVGFDALRNSLPKIKTLGVNVMWLMPIQPVGKLRSAGGIGSPYAISDYRAINPEFGDETSFRRLVEAAHKLKIAVIIDWVPDHTAWDSAWIKAHPDWYLHNSKGEISIPPGTGWNDVAALDYKSAAMRAAMIDSMKSWVSRFAIDGFRCDAADRMPLDFWRTAISSLRAATHEKLLMLAEGFQAQDYAAGFDLTYGWDFCAKLRAVFGGKPATGIAASSAFEAKNIPVGARRLRFVTNHDISAWEGSMLELYKTRDGERTAFTIAALYGGVPLIFTGQEVDWDKRIPIFDQSSIDWTKNGDAANWLGRLMELRRTHPALSSGSVTDFSTADVVFFSRSQGSDQALVLANVRDRPATVTIPGAYQGTWKDGQLGGAVKLGSDFTILPAYGCVVLVRKAGAASQPLR